ncbi:MAG: hypothetical protein R3327_05615 [Nitrosopumilaceae archaeon]|nr:hypothetical protein [Nitrosopumilaceae archaeon]
MKIGSAIIGVGLIMFILGLVAFYSIDATPESDEFLRTIKHTGTFVGLMGIGVTVAGILLYLINRGSPQQEQTFDV